MPNSYAKTRDAQAVNLHPLRWLWPTRIPLGSVTLLVGDPGVGKSLLAATLAAHVSTARTFPDGKPSCPMFAAEDVSDFDPTLAASLQSSPWPGGVVYLSAEDDPATVLIPRLTQAGADLNRIAILDGVIDERSYEAEIAEIRAKARQDYGCHDVGCHADGSASACLPPLSSVPFVPSLPSLRPPSSLPCIPSPLTLPTHTGALAQAIRSISHTRLLIIDTLPAILDPGPVSLANVMRVLADLANTYTISILALTHLAKERTHRPIYRVRGSLTYAAAARTILMLTADPDQPDRRILATMKSVYTRPPAPLAFRINNDGKIEWEPDPLPPVSPDLLDLSPEGQSALADAVGFLERELANGPRLVKELTHEAKCAGHSFRTLRRAKRLLNVRSARDPGAPGWHWYTSPVVHIKTAPAPPPREGGQQSCSPF